MNPVSRLKKTWSKVNTAKFEILEVRTVLQIHSGTFWAHVPVSSVPQHQMDPSSNFSNYRTALRGATQRSETAHCSQEKVRFFFAPREGLPAAVNVSSWSRL